MIDQIAISKKLANSIGFFFLEVSVTRQVKKKKIEYESISITDVAGLSIVSFYNNKKKKYH